MTDDLPVRGARVRRRSAPRRASRGVSPRRAIAALAMLATAGLVWGAVASPVFGVKDVVVEGADLTGEAAVRAALALPEPAPNAFTIATDDLRERLLVLPAVADADVRVELPGALHVRVVEREPVLAWRSGQSLLLVDVEGRVLADAEAEGAAAAAAADGLPLVVDRREAGTPPLVGGVIDPLDFDVATRLLGLSPTDVGSAAPGLLVAVDDADGWTVVPVVEDPWTAVFGFYGQEIRTVDMIPEQVRLLRSLLADAGEGTVLRAILAGERAGTYIEKRD